MKALDVRKGDTVIVYEKGAVLSGPRAYWMLKTFGVHDIYLMNGTFTKWMAEKRPIESGDNESAWKNIRNDKPNHGDYAFKVDTSRIKYFEDIQKLVDS